MAIKLPTFKIIDTTQKTNWNIEFGTIIYLPKDGIQQISS